MGATATTGAHTLQFLPHLRVALPADEIVEGKDEIVDGKDRKNIINPAETTSQDPPTGRASGRGCSLGGRQRRRCGPARTRPSSHDSVGRSGEERRGVTALGRRSLLAACAQIALESSGARCLIHNLSARRHSEAGLQTTGLVTRCPGKENGGD
uniref:Uncharacterized protein n=2 Tax=Oryza sativa subsp. japonica TaxID=39947 RepID=Q2R732_ORYSJ|nr:hypothetical protein LOC_Os11g17980 [Oryza sativa Japonica Group]ABA92702.1 hypothetical protein LOC_Os11g17980 [Oryza sativa Japonica Group]